MKISSTKKKVVLGVALVSAIALVGLQSAGAGPWGGGPGRWGGSPNWQCDGSGYWGQRQLDEKSVAARDTFLSETVDLRKTMATKRAEKKALMLNDNPDAKRIGELTGELFDLREQLHKKAQEKGLQDFGFDRGRRFGCGGPGPRGL